MSCYYHSGREAVSICAVCGQFICAECKVVLGGEVYCNPCADALVAATVLPEKLNWFQRHLNWTWFFAYLIWIPLNSTRYLDVQIIGSVLLLIASGWVIKQKGRSLWWILLVPVFSPLWLHNKKREAPDQGQPESRIYRVRRGFGGFVKTVGFILWLGCGLVTTVLIFGLIADAAGTWVAIIGIIFFPVLFGFAPLIHWLITGTFPLLYLILWLVGWGAALTIYLGGRIKGDEYSE